jgi:DNA-directed RNA polymerase specialized sigma24 family protein
MEPTRELVEQALAADARARRALVDALAPVIQRRVAIELFRRKGLARGRDLQQEVEDMTQQVFVAVLEGDGRALRAWSPDRGLSLSEFVSLLAAREVVSILRSGRRSPWKEDSVADEVMDAYVGAEDGPELLASARNFGAALVERLREELSPKGIEIFELLFVRERGVAEVAGSLGMTTDAVYAWRSRLAKRARQIARTLRGEKDEAPPATAQAVAR